MKNEKEMELGFGDVETLIEEISALALGWEEVRIVTLLLPAGPFAWL